MLALSRFTRATKRRKNKRKGTISFSCACVYAYAYACIIAVYTVVSCAYAYAWARNNMIFLARLLVLIYSKLHSESWDYLQLNNLLTRPSILLPYKLNSFCSLMFQNSILTSNANVRIMAFPRSFDFVRTLPIGLLIISLDI